MNTRGAAIATNDDRLRKAARPDAWQLAPQAGDILLSEGTARADVLRSASSRATATSP
jgi:hypothetical protein